jgi:hypothetical protein
MRAKYDKRIVEIFLLCVLSVLSVSTYSLNDDISIIRQRVLEQMIWPTPNSIVSIVQRALQYSGTLRPPTPSKTKVGPGKSKWAEIWSIC